MAVEEEWRPCFCGHYEVSSSARVRRKSTGRFLSASPNGSGYLKTSVCVEGNEITVSVHRLVAEAFHGPCPDGYVVNHIDGNKRNNVPENLEYVTPRENSLHAARAGLAPSGKRHGRSTKPERTARGERVNTAKLNEDQVKEARSLRASGWKLSQLCARFGISKSAMHALCSGKNWGHV